jgi:hypothetical protein
MQQSRESPLAEMQSRRMRESLWLMLLRWLIMIDQLVALQ